MVSDLNKLAELVELDSLPLWIRQDIELKRDEILEQLHSNGSFVFCSPKGEKYTIRAKLKAAAA